MSHEERETIEALASKSLSEAVTLSRRGIDDYRVDLPFCFADGDHLKVILKSASDGRWTLTDEAHTLMYLSYHDIEIDDSSSRRDLFDNILRAHQMTEQDGRLIMADIALEDIGAAIFTFSQAVLKVGDFAMWRRERIKSMFLEDFRREIPHCVGGREHAFDHRYEVLDPNGYYPVDCLVKGYRVVHIYAVNSDTRAKNAGLAMRYYDDAGMRIPSSVIFDASANIDRKSYTQAADAAEKTIPSLEAASDLLPVFLDKMDRVADGQ